MTTTQIMPGIRHVKQPSNIGSKGPVMPQINDLPPTQVVGEVEGKKGALKSEVDPLAYYCALVLIAGMDELLTGGGYCRIGARRYCELDETIRAWNWLEAEGLAG